MRVYFSEKEKNTLILPVNELLHVNPNFKEAIRFYLVGFYLDTCFSNGPDLMCCMCMQFHRSTQNMKMPNYEITFLLAHLLKRFQQIEKIM